MSRRKVKENIYLSKIGPLPGFLSHIIYKKFSKRIFKIVWNAPLTKLRDLVSLSWLFEICVLNTFILSVDATSSAPTHRDGAESWEQIVVCSIASLLNLAGLSSPAFFCVNLKKLLRKITIYLFERYIFIFLYSLSPLQRYIFCVTTLVVYDFNY